MTSMVALLRGINVGGRNRLAMVDLRAIAADLGYRDIATYIQSGNLLFATEQTAARVGPELEAAIASATEVAPSVVVRAGRELLKVRDRNPYLARGVDSAHLHVVFAPGNAKAAVASLDLSAFGPDSAVAIGGELYLHLPNGVGRSKLATAIAKRGAAAGTMRSWKTVLALAELLTAMDLSSGR